MSTILRRDFLRDTSRDRMRDLETGALKYWKRIKNDLIKRFKIPKMFVEKVCFSKSIRPFVQIPDRKSREENMDSRKILPYLILSFLFILTHVKTTQCIKLSEQISKGISSSCLNPQNIVVNRITATQVVVHLVCSNNIISITGETNEFGIETVVVTAFDVPSECPRPTSIFVNRAAEMLYVTCQGEPSDFFGTIINVDFDIDESAVAIRTLATIPGCRRPSNVFVSTIIGRSGNTEIVYAICDHSDGATVISINKDDSPRIKTILNSSQCSNPSSLFVTDMVYVTCLDDSRGSVGTVIAINNDGELTILADFSQCPSPSKILINGGAVYAACFDGEIIRIRGGEITALVPASQCPNPSSLTVDSTTGMIYATCQGITATVIGINENNIYGTARVTILATSSQCQNPTNMAIDSISKSLYVICNGGNTDGDVREININGDTVTALTNFLQCPYPQSVAIAGVRGIVYAICKDIDLISIDGGTVKTIATSSQCFGPSNVFGNDILGLLYVTCRGGGVISVTVDADPINTSITALISPSECLNPTGIALEIVTVARVIVHVACINYVDARVVSVDDKIVTAVSISSQCLNPRGIAVDSLAGVIYVACFDDGVISIGERGKGEIKVAIASNHCRNSNSIAINTITGTVYATCSDGKIVSLEEGVVTTLFAPFRCRNLQNMAIRTSKISSTGNNLLSAILYVSCLDGDVISVNIGGNAAIKALVTPSSCQNPRSVIVDSNTGIVYIACLRGHLLAVGSHFKCPRGYHWTRTGCLLHSIEIPHSVIPAITNCDVCSVSSSMFTLDSTCSPCGNLNSSVILLPVLYSIIFVATVHYISQSKSSLYLSILFYAVYLGLTIWSGDQNLFVDWLDGIYLIPSRLTGPCRMNIDLYQAMVADAIIPFLYFFELLLIMVIHYCFQYLVCIDYNFTRSVRHFPTPFTFDKKQYIRTFTSLYLVYLSIILTLILRYMYCIDVEEEVFSELPGDTRMHVVSVLYFNSRVSCDDLKYKRWLLFWIFMLTGAICLIPAVIIVYLCRTGSNKVPYIHEPYSFAIFYHHVFSLFRKLLVGVFATILTVCPENMYIHFVLFQIVLRAINGRIKSRKESQTDRIDEMNLLLLTLLSCILTVYPSPPMTTHMTAIVWVLCGVPCALLIMDIQLPYRSNFENLA